MDPNEYDALLHADIAARLHALISIAEDQYAKAELISKATGIPLNQVMLWLLEEHLLRQNN